MPRWVGVGVALVCVAGFCFGQQPAKDSDAATNELVGAVHTVQIDFYVHDIKGEPKLFHSVHNVFDQQGYFLEQTFYEGDGSLYSHLKYTRKGGLLLKVETTSPKPSENITFQARYDEHGRQTATEDYDGSGQLMDKTENEGISRVGGTEVSTVVRPQPDRSDSIEKKVESVDPKTGLTHEVVTKDGKLQRDRLVQKDEKGNIVSDVMKFPDGTTLTRELRPDGTSVEDHYSDKGKFHYYTTRDKNGRVLETRAESPNGQSVTRYKYDDVGRNTEIATFDRTGTLIAIVTHEYEDDSFGNWILQRSFQWEKQMGKVPPRLMSETRRVISYY